MADSLEKIIAEMRDKSERSTEEAAASYIHQWAERLAALPKHDGWQPIETAPKDGWFLAASVSGVCSEIVRYDGGKTRNDKTCYWFDGHGYYREKTFSHWKPLPLPPPPTVDEREVES